MTSSVRRKLSSLVFLTGALGGFNVVVSASQRCSPVGDNVFRAGQVVRPGVTGNQTGSLSDNFELAIILDLADQYRLGDVMVREHG